MKIKILEQELKVKNFYPYRYPNGKMVLRFEVTDETVSFSDIYSLLNDNQFPIEFYENDEDLSPKCTYYGYSELSVNYNNGVYKVEQATPSTVQSAIDTFKAKSETQERTIQEQAEKIKEQSEKIQEQAENIDMLSECILDMSTIIYADSEMEEV